MSETFEVFLDRTRETMTAVGRRGDQLVSPVTLAKIANDRLQAVAAAIGQGETIDPAFITLAADDGDYTVPTTSIEFLTVLALTYVPDGHEILPQTPEWIHQERGSSSEKGPPANYSIQPTAVDGKWLVMFHPIPGAQENGRAVRGELRLVPEFLDLETATTDIIPFDSPLLRAFEQDVAAHALLSVPEAKREELGISADLIQRLLDGAGWNPKNPERLSGPYLHAWRRNTASRRSRSVMCYGVTRGK